MKISIYLVTPYLKPLAISFKGLRESAIAEKRKMCTRRVNTKSKTISGAADCRCRVYRVIIYATNAVSYDVEDVGIILELYTRKP